MTLALSKPIRTRSPLTPAPAIADRRAEIEQWVSRWTRKKVNLSNPDFKFVGPRGNRSERDAVLSFASALQVELVHFEGWGTNA